MSDKKQSKTSARKTFDLSGVVETRELPKADPKPEKESVMYVGPTVNGIGIQNRVYSGIPESATKKIEADAELGFLFIPISDYPVANRMIRERDGYIYNAYKKALQHKK